MNKLGAATVGGLCLIFAYVGWAAEPRGAVADSQLSATTADQRVEFSIRESVIQSFYSRVCESPADGQCDTIENYRVRIEPDEEGFVVGFVHTDRDTSYVRTFGCVFSGGVLGCARTDRHVMPRSQRE